MTVQHPRRGPKRVRYRRRCTSITRATASGPLVTDDLSHYRLASHVCRHQNQSLNLRKGYP